MAKRSIRGIKLSTRMVALRVTPSPQGEDLFGRFCRYLAEARINLSFVVTSAMGAQSRSLCCIDWHDQSKMAAAIVDDEELKTSVTVLPPVGLVHFYPHDSSLAMLGEALATLYRSQIAVHGLSTSISSICLVVDFGRLNDAATLLARRFHLPDNHSPLRSDFSVRQIMPPL